MNDKANRARAASVRARRALIDAIASGASGAELRRAAMRVWTYADQVLPSLGVGRPSWTRTRLWRAWAESIALHDTIPDDLVEIAQAAAARVAHDNNRAAGALEME